MHIENVIVHVVHGTWPYGFWAAIRRRRRPKLGQELPWFMENSQFQKSVSLLSMRSLVWVPFEWDGRNAFASREAAASALSRHLLQWMSAEPCAEHIVIAHSHGGSVAVAAARILDSQRDPSATTLRVITLASPFAQRRLSDRDENLLAVRYLILRFGWVPLGLFLSLWILAGTTNLVAWADRPEFSSPFKLTLALYFCIFSFLYVVGTRFLDIRNPALPPWQKVVIPQTWKLYAIRSPQDEASIAITTSQFVNLCLDLFFQRILVGPFRWASRIMGLGLGEDGLKVLFIYILPIEVIGIISINIADAYYSTDSTALLISLVIALAPVAIFLMSIVIVIYATLLGSLVLIPANLILAVALGGDLWRSGGLADVECEPMPSGVTGVVSMIRISAEDRKELGMVHFLHATKAARERVAAIINDMHT